MKDEGLDRKIKEIADAVLRDGVDVSSGDEWPLRDWLTANVKMREGTEFFVWFLTACELGERWRAERDAKKRIELPQADDAVGQRRKQPHLTTRA